MGAEFAYLLIVTSVTLVILFWLQYGLRHLEKTRAKRIEKLEQFNAIATKTPEGVANSKQSRTKALEGLEVRFSIVRRTFSAIVIMGWLIATAAPFIGNVPTTLISLFITAGAVVVGIAARPMVENFIAGFVLTFSKQFHTGDTILVDNEYGTIEDITPTHTVIKLWDWRRYIIPNSGMLSKEIINLSTRDSFIWVKLEFYIAHSADLALVESIAVRIASESPYLVGKEIPRFWIMAIEKEALKCWLAMWTASPPDAWSMRVEVGRQLVDELNKHGIKTHTYLHGGMGKSDIFV